MSETALRALLEALPDDALLPVKWVKAHLEAPACASSGAVVADLSAVDVAAELGRRPGTIRGWFARGDFPGAYRLHGREWRVPRAALRAYLDRQAAARRDDGDAGAVDLGSWRQHTRRRKE